MSKIELLAKDKEILESVCYFQILAMCANDIAKSDANIIKMNEYKMFESMSGASEITFVLFQTITTLAYEMLQEIFNNGISEKLYEMFMHLRTTSNVEDIAKNISLDQEKLKIVKSECITPSDIENYIRGYIIDDPKSEKDEDKLNINYEKDVFPFRLKILSEFFNRKTKKLNLMIDMIDKMVAKEFMNNEFIIAWKKGAKLILLDILKFAKISWDKLSATDFKELGIIGNKLSTITGNTEHDVIKMRSIIIAKHLNLDTPFIPKAAKK